MTFLDDFYYGNIKPADNEFMQNSEFNKVLKAFCSCESELRKANNAINKNADDTFTRLINSHNKLLAMTGLENFKTGFRLGVRMICAALIDENGVFKEISD